MTHMMSQASKNSLTLYSLDEEPWLEKWARIFRYWQAIPSLKKSEQIAKPVILDIGCGQDILFAHYLQDHFPALLESGHYFGIDPLMKVKGRTFPKGVTIIPKMFQHSESKTIPSGDLIVMFALLEHVPDPFELLSFAVSKLKKGGRLVLTTPSPLAKPILEFLAFTVGIISEREIDEHENYFTRQDLLALYEQLPAKLKKSLSVHHKYFELGLNNLLVIEKN